ncbi:hypothetical protein BCV53_12485 [Parageobacillus thermoglucosidasius]|uniref:Uncharacterized protein n=1 Tax=Parageobacillus thermoglucosidasius TaxID=1426 RepID=A0AAN0YT88_PARTM|nr:hypothetical protein AOT13_12475 [Parageobacillus thermoglucosidasius]ANZ30843.1 hypothetical protein BCV53_12485 [Parageobacillus thermoglucosidasius]APM81580.1 hypothetical protein BCV54_12495 [Parageobacillus thermoglucosidasius]KJX67659.1 hypothetical protein WH82_16465 [Parageobacillus thermoglucosidasius]RDE22173.1 hypothetical protein DV712_19205 [Parageobacillus thermoglucosidasius]
MDMYSIRQFENCVNMGKILIFVEKSRKINMSSIPWGLCAIRDRRQKYTLLFNEFKHLLLIRLTAKYSLRKRKDQPQSLYTLKACL